MKNRLRLASAKEFVKERHRKPIVPGDVVYRKGEPCTVVVIQRDTVPPHVVVRLEDGREVGVEMDHLKREKDAPWNPSATQFKGTGPPLPVSPSSLTGDSTLPAMLQDCESALPDLGLPEASKSADERRAAMGRLRQRRADRAREDAHERDEALATMMDADSATTDAEPVRSPAKDLPSFARVTEPPPPLQREPRPPESPRTRLPSPSRPSPRRLRPAAVPSLVHLPSSPATPSSSSRAVPSKDESAKQDQAAQPSVSSVSQRSPSARPSSGGSLSKALPPVAPASSSRSAEKPASAGASACTTQLPTPTGTAERSGTPLPDLVEACSQRSQTQCLAREGSASAAEESAAGTPAVGEGSAAREEVRRVLADAFVTGQLQLVLARMWQEGGADEFSPFSCESTMQPHEAQTGEEIADTGESGPLPPSAACVAADGSAAVGDDAVAAPPAASNWRQHGCAELETAAQEDVALAPSLVSPLAAAEAVAREASTGLVLGALPAGDSSPPSGVPAGDAAMVEVAAAAGEPPAEEENTGQPAHQATSDTTTQRQETAEGQHEQEEEEERRQPVQEVASRCDGCPAEEGSSAGLQLAAGETTTTQAPSECSSSTVDEDLLGPSSVSVEADATAIMAALGQASTAAAGQTERQQRTAASTVLDLVAGDLALDNAADTAAAQSDARQPLACSAGNESPTEAQQESSEGQPEPPTVGSADADGERATVPEHTPAESQESSEGQPEPPTVGSADAAGERAAVPEHMPAESQEFSEGQPEPPTVGSADAVGERAAVPECTPAESQEMYEKLLEAMRLLHDERLRLEAAHGAERQRLEEDRRALEEERQRVQSERQQLDQERQELNVTLRHQEGLMQLAQEEAACEADSCGGATEVDVLLCLDASYAIHAPLSLTQMALESWDEKAWDAFGEQLRSRAEPCRLEPLGLSVLASLGQALDDVHVHVCIGGGTEEGEGGQEPVRLHTTSLDVASLGRQWRRCLRRGGGGSLWRQAAQAAQELVSRGLQRIVVLTGSDDGEPCEALREIGVPVHVVSLGAPRAASQGRALSLATGGCCASLPLEQGGEASLDAEAAVESLLGSLRELPRRTLHLRLKAEEDARRSAALLLREEQEANRLAAERQEAVAKEAARRIAAAYGCYRWRLSLAEAADEGRRLKRRAPVAAALQRRLELREQADADAAAKKIQAAWRSVRMRRWCMRVDRAARRLQGWCRARWRRQRIEREAQRLRQRKADRLRLRACDRPGAITAPPPLPLSCRNVASAPSSQDPAASAQTTSAWHQSLPGAVAPGVGSKASFCCPAPVKKPGLTDRAVAAPPSTGPPLPGERKAPARRPLPFLKALPASIAGGLAGEAKRWAQELQPLPLPEAAS
eukprot:TRINITY_DN3974_c0_g1_i1.p1 TRINITY_DN3974_c0_g1~~TRINITY_DN3974_c0_g1_i1.p1  ORF type:complete len:1376 (+),score=361.15 TRINITY_DN3974_c0_g1_i1:84-4211(+)